MSSSRARIVAAVLALAAAFTSAPLAAQTPAPALSGAARVGVRTSAAAAAPQRPGTPPAGDLERWIDLQVASVDFRYRYIETSRDHRTANQLQHKQRLRVGLKLDPDGRYTIQTFSGTSNSFNSSWANTGLGTGEAGWGFAMRELYLAARPGGGFSAEVGGIHQLKGLASEITTFDNDNYLVGYRAGVSRPAELYLDELSLTLGHVGDFGNANVLERLDRLGDHNYTQVLARKRFSPAVALSADWESVDGISTLHQAVEVTLPEGQAIDGVRFEQYERVEGETGYGFAAAAERDITTRLSVSGGYAQIDLDYVPTLNGDRYARGRRLFVESRYRLSPELTVDLYYGHAINNDFVVPNAQRLDIVASYNVLRALQRAGVW